MREIAFLESSNQFSWNSKCTHNKTATRFEKIVNYYLRHCSQICMQKKIKNLSLNSRDSSGCTEKLWTLGICLLYLNNMYTQTVKNVYKK